MMYVGANMLYVLPNDKLFERVFTKFFKDNPQCRRGEPMRGPVGFARNGVQLDDHPADELDGSSTIIEARSFKIKYDEDDTLPSLEISHRGWVYPYMVVCCGSPEILKAKVGDEITLVNPNTFLPEQIKVTKELQAENRVLSLRLALGGTYTPEPDSYI
jgi:hypothetical protein